MESIVNSKSIKLIAIFQIIGGVINFYIFSHSFEQLFVLGNLQGYLILTISIFLPLLSFFAGWLLLSNRTLGLYMSVGNYVAQIVSIKAGFLTWSYSNLSAVLLYLHISEISEFGFRLNLEPPFAVGLSGPKNYSLVTLDLSAVLIVCILVIWQARKTNNARQ